MASPATRFEQLVVAAGVRAIPLDVSIELTHHCNFRCRHCYIPDFHAEDGLSTERVLRLLEELAELGTLFLTLTGGELFLRRDWLRIAHRARHLGFDLRLFSNGSLISDEIAEEIAGLCATVEVSLYSMSEAIFEEVTCRPGSFARTIAGIRTLRARDVNVLLKVPMMTLNRGELDAVVDFAGEVGAEVQAFPTLMPKKDGDLSVLSLRLSHSEALPILGGPATGCALPLGGEVGKSVEGPLCAAASRFCCITASGEVQACNILPGSGGNVNERSFREIWEESPWLNEVRSIRRGDLKECSTCDRLSVCGRCHAQALLEDGDLYGPSSYARERAEMIFGPTSEEDQ